MGDSAEAQERETAIGWRPTPREMVTMAKERFPEDKAMKLWEKDGLKYAIVKHGELEHYCGYVIFPKGPKPYEGGGWGLDVVVHGGITFDEVREDGSMVYGFDCNHYRDEERSEVRDIDWLTEECERMGDGVKALIRERERLNTDEHVKTELFNMAKDINANDPLAIAEWTRRLMSAASFLIDLPDVQKYSFSIHQVKRALQMMQGKEATNDRATD